MRRSTLGMMMLVAALGCDDDGDGGRNGGPDAGSAGSELDCPDLIACVEACATDVCVQGCVDAASQQALTIVSTVLDCVETHACGDDDACITANCSSEIAACGVDFDPGEVDVPPPTDDFPLRVSGTLVDDSPLFLLNSTAEVTYVRDEEGGMAVGFPADRVVAYRMETVTYRSTKMGTAGNCSFHADETETFSSPSQLGNYLVIERATESNGQHIYSVGASLSVDHPGGETITCTNPSSVDTEDFEAGLSISSRPLEPTSDLVTFQGSKDAGAGRTIFWDLHAVE